MEYIILTNTTTNPEYDLDPSFGGVLLETDSGLKLLPCNQETQLDMLYHEIKAAYGPHCHVIMWSSSPLNLYSDFNEAVCVLGREVIGQMMEIFCNNL